MYLHSFVWETSIKRKLKWIFFFIQKLQFKKAHFFNTNKPTPNLKMYGYGYAAYAPAYGCGAYGCGYAYYWKISQLKTPFQGSNALFSWPLIKMWQKLETSKEDVLLYLFLLNLKAMFL